MYNLSSIYKSLISHIQNMIEEARMKGISDDLQYYAWDSRGELGELDNTDLVGLSNWTFRENGGLWEIRAGVTLSTFNDVNLFRQMQLIDLLHDYFGESQHVPMLNPDNGEQYTHLVVSDFDMLPTGQSERRNYLPLGIELLRTESG